MNLVRLCLTSTALLLTTAPGLADEVLGTWLRDNGALKVKFEPCGDAVCGNVVWLKPGSESKAKIGQRLCFDMHRHAPRWDQFLDRQSRRSGRRVNLFRQNVDRRRDPQYFGLHSRWTNLQVGELEESALTRDWPTPFQPVSETKDVTK